MKDISLIDSTSEQNLQIDQKNKSKKLKLNKKNIFIFLGLGLFLILLFLVQQRVALVHENGKNHVLLSWTPIKEEDKTVILVKPKAGGYYSQSLNINLNLYAGLSGEEYLGKMKVREYGKKGEVLIERYKTDYSSLSEAEEKTKNEKLKTAAKENFITKSGVQGRVYKIKESTQRIYFLYFDHYIYFLETSDPDLYKALNYIAIGLYYGEPYEEVRKRPTSVTEPIFILQKKVKESTKTIFEFDSNGNSSVVRWKDFILLTNNYGNHNGELTIYLHDINTGETKSLFKKQSELIMSDLNIINDTLYFSLGDYLKDGESYWIDLNSKNKVAYKLADKSGWITDIKGRYFFVKSRGDACWGESDFSLINLQTKVLIPVAETRSGCGGGDEYLGINKKDQMILADHTGVSLDVNYGWPSPNLYTKVMVIPLSTPSVRKDIILEQSMPSDIFVVKYSEENDSLLLVGDSAYTYSFISNELEKIVDFPQDWIDYKRDIILLGWSGKVACVEKSDDDYKKRLVLFIDLGKNQFSRDTSSCPTEHNNSIEEYTKQEVEKMVQELNLPSSYSLIKK